MDNNNFKSENQPRDYKYYIFVFQTIFASVFILAALVIKLLDMDIYSDINEWYVNNFTKDTSISEVVGPYTEYSDYGSDDYTVFSK